MKRLHIISDMATPHNDCLIGALRKIEGLETLTWYRYRKLDEYPWKEKLEQFERNLYFEDWPSFFRAFSAIGFSAQDRCLFVGNSNLLSRLLIPFFFLKGRKFWYWTDCPLTVTGLAKKALRRISNFFLKKRAKTIFCVGRSAVATMQAQGFPRNRLENLPIFIKLPVLDAPFQARRAAMREKLGVGEQDILFVGASRLIHAKGYDFLIKALTLMKKPLPKNLKVLILGNGPEEAPLKALLCESLVWENVIFQPWADPKDYELIIGSANVFVHPARFDAFGGGTLHAMAYGVPVLGSDGAGTVVERVVHGKNGFLHRAGDIQSLSDQMFRLFTDSAERKLLGENARKTAEEWPPERGAKILYETIFGETHE